MSALTEPVPAIASACGECGGGLFDWSCSVCETSAEPVPARPEAGLWTRFLDAAERLLWANQDAELAAAGWQVTATGRWSRTYRHPAALAAALSAQTRISSPL